MRGCQNCCSPGVGLWLVVVLVLPLLRVLVHVLVLALVQVLVVPALVPVSGISNSAGTSTSTSTVTSTNKHRKPAPPTGGTSPRFWYATPPPPLPALRAHLVAKGQQLLAIHIVAPKAPEIFFFIPLAHFVHFAPQHYP